MCPWVSSLFAVRISLETDTLEQLSIWLWDNPPHREEQNCWPPHAPTSSTSSHADTQTSMSSWRRALTQTHSPEVPQETDAAMFTAAPEILTGRSSRPAAIIHAVFLPVHPSLPLFFLLLFLSDVFTSTLRSVYLSEATTQQVLLLGKSKSGGGVAYKFPEERASAHTQENVNRAWSISDNK